PVVFAPVSLHDAVPIAQVAARAGYLGDQHGLRARRRREGRVQLAPVSGALACEAQAQVHDGRAGRLRHGGGREVPPGRRVPGGEHLDGGGDERGEIGGPAGQGGRDRGWGEGQGGGGIRGATTGLDGDSSAGERGGG